MDMAVGSIFITSPELDVVEGLLLLLTWLFPSTPTRGENTFVMCGSLIHLAMRIGLHMPLSSQDFARTKLRLSDEDLRRRSELWVQCVTLYTRSSFLLKCVGWPTNRDAVLAVFMVNRRYKLLICQSSRIRLDICGTAFRNAFVFISNYKRSWLCRTQRYWRPLLATKVSLIGQHLRQC